MAILIGSNIASQIARRNLDGATNDVGSALKRLASGQRIVTAADDAAGVAISSTLSAERLVTRQAIRNVNDGLSVTAVATSALQALSQISIRQRELTVQAANGVYSDKQREALAKEQEQLTNEYNRVVQTTQFNSIQLLEDPSSSIGIQVGGNSDQNVIMLKLAETLAGSNSATAATVESGSNTITAGSYLTVNATSGKHYLWFSVDGSGADPSPAGAGTGHQVALTSNAMSGSAVAQAVRDAVNTIGAFTASDLGGGVVQVVNGSNGSVADASAATSSATVTVTQQGSPASLTVGGGGGALAVADFNSDGKLDLAATSSAGGLNVYFGNGDGSFGGGTYYATGASPSGISTVDMNGDGKSDLVVSNSNGQNVSVLINNGNGTFANAVNTALGSNAFRVVTADFNGDNHPDVAVTIGLANAVRVLLNNGDGTLNSGTNYSVGTSPLMLSAGDLNGDNIPDIVTQTGVGTTSVALNNGNGTFGPSVDYTGSGFPIAGAIADVNGDHFNDIIAVENTTNQISQFINNGNGTFQPRVDYTVGGTPAGVMVGDYNEDGALDLAVTNIGSNSISVLLNNGNGTYSAKTDFGLSFSPNGQPVTTDINGDGHLDLVVSGTAANTVQVLMGDGHGSFSSRAEIARLDFSFLDSSPTSSGLGATLITNPDVSTAAAALSSMAEIDSRLENISKCLGAIGAVESRLSAAVGVLQSNYENYSAAQSRIVDADVAHEVTKLTLSSIKQQTAISILAQANQSPSIALQVLRLR